jgi:hypothetical protein
MDELACSCRCLALGYLHLALDIGERKGSLMAPEGRHVIYYHSARAAISSLIKELAINGVLG